MNVKNVAESLSFQYGGGFKLTCSDENVDLRLLFKNRLEEIILCISKYSK